MDVELDGYLSLTFWYTVRLDGIVIYTGEDMTVIGTLASIGMAVGCVQSSKNTPEPNCGPSVENDADDIRPPLIYADQVRSYC